jgi:class 3 adenylate cyclase
LAEKILHSKGALGGERKLVSLLFADLKGSMELLVDPDPEEARQLLEDLAVRACYAALAMQASVRQCAEEVQRTHAMSIQMDISLNSSEVVVRSIGSDLHMGFTAVGRPHI